jgi:hypothetical protein
MQNKPSLPDRLFGNIAQITARPRRNTSRRTFIQRIAGLGLFLFSVTEIARGQEGGGCDPWDQPDDCFCCSPYAGSFQICNDPDCGAPSSPDCTGCCYGACIGVYSYNMSTQQCCGVNGPISIDEMCCQYNCGTCCSKSAGYDPDTQGCCGDGVYDKCTQGCCSGITYELATQCCCPCGCIETCIPDSTTYPPPGC